MTPATISILFIVACSLSLLVTGVLRLLKKKENAWTPLLLGVIGCIWSALTIVHDYYLHVLDAKARLYLAHYKFMTNLTAVVLGIELISNEIQAKKKQSDPPTERIMEGDMLPTQTDENVEAGLRRIVRLRIWLLVLWGAVLPCFGAIHWAMTLPQWFWSIALLVYFVTFVIVGLMHAFARCPACHRFFNVRGLYGNAFTFKCLNCNIPLW